MLPFRVIFLSLNSLIIEGEKFTSSARIAIKQIEKYENRKF